MKKIFAGLTVLTVCGVLNFGLINEAQAEELDSSIDMSGLELQETSSQPMRLHAPPPPPPPPPNHHHHAPPPNPFDDDWSHGHRPPPPPPPPPHRW